MDGKVVAASYGKVTGIALDPIEKKPLRHFKPGSMILSIGSFGCNLRCPFCQNSNISWSEEAMAMASRTLQTMTGKADATTGSDSTRPVHPTQTTTPEEIAGLAKNYENRGNIGVAFTYNEPLIGYEFVRDTARLVREKGMKNVLVTNGTAELSVLAQLLPHIDAMNIDLKGFSEGFYRKIGGSLAMTKAFIEEAVKGCHVELTTLIVPGENDSHEEMEEMTGWIAGLTDGKGNVIGSTIPLHISRFFPTFNMTDRPPTDVGRIYELVDLAKKRLDHVHPGNC